MLIPPIPKTLELRKMMGQKVDIAGQIELNKLDRLQSYLCDESGIAVVSLSFGKDLEGTQTIIGELSAKTFMQCQRCLKPVAIDVSATVNVGVCYRENNLKHLSNKYDPLLQEQPELNLWQFIEDELILGLPIVAHHSATDCNIDVQYQQWDETKTEQTINPFAVLAGMKGDSDD